LRRKTVLFLRWGVLLAAAVVGCNFLADLLYRVMDPRIDGR